MTINKILQGSALEKLQELQENTTDLLVTDPPYGYAFMNKDWDKAIVSVDTWHECMRVLKPGAFAFIMSSPRQDVLSRMIVNLQDAGFETNFTSLYHAYASGFPKAANVSKLTDKRGGNGKALEGTYAGFQPKPAVEVILICMKPLSEKTYVDQALSNGKGITWLDDCRIPYQSEHDKDIRPDSELTTSTDQYHFTNHQRGDGNDKGRFPANLLVSDDILNDGKVTKSTGGKGSPIYSENIYGKYANTTIRNGGYNDEGSFSRYFSLDKWTEKQKTFPFLIVPKASKGEKDKGLDTLPITKVMGGGGTYNYEAGHKFGSIKSPKHNTHPTVKPLQLMSYLITMGSRPNDLVLDPFAGSGTTLIASYKLARNFVGIELNPEYIKMAKARLDPYLKQERISQYY